MKPKDPQNVACPHCFTTSTQRVAELLALKATCPKCSGSLADAGLKMRRAYDDGATYMIAMELTFALEKALGCRLEDEGLEQVKTLRDVISFVGPTREVTATKAMAEAVQQVRRNGMFSHVYTGPEPNAVLNLDDRLVEVFMPNRWDRP
jgi:hypothetical protein